MSQITTAEFNEYEKLQYDDIKAYRRLSDKVLVQCAINEMDNSLYSFIEDEDTPNFNSEEDFWKMVKSDIVALNGLTDKREIKLMRRAQRMYVVQWEKYLKEKSAKEAKKAKKAQEAKTLTDAEIENFIKNPLPPPKKWRDEPKKKITSSLKNLCKYIVEECIQDKYEDGTVLLCESVNIINKAKKLNAGDNKTGKKLKKLILSSIDYNNDGTDITPLLYNDNDIYKLAFKILNNRKPKAHSDDFAYSLLGNLMGNIHLDF